MTSKLLRKIAPASAGEHVGGLRWFDKNIYGKELNTGALYFGINRQWRRIEESLNAQLAPLDFYDLYILISPEHRDQADLDFESMEAGRGRDYALSAMRRWIKESHLHTELIRVEMDFTRVKSKRPESIILFSRESRRAFKSEKSLEARINKSTNETKFKEREADFQSFHVTNLAMRSPQRSPNAPNFVPALSLAAA